jgi:hypothetical protein
MIVLVRGCVRAAMWTLAARRVNAACAAKLPQAVLRVARSGEWGNAFGRIGRRTGRSQPAGAGSPPDSDADGVP